MADLNKYGVPIDGERQGILHPKQSYRFRVRFNNFGINQRIRELTNQVVTCTRPTINQEIVPLHVYNSVGYVAGKHEWDPIELTLRDDINNSVISEIGAQLQRQVNHFEQTSAVAGINYKFSMNVDSLDGTNNEELESWRLDGCWLSSTDYPEGDYSSSDPNMVTMTIRYDNATNISGPNTNGGNTTGDDPFIDLPSLVGGATFG